VHHLEGKIASLPKPLGILTKRKTDGQTEYEITQVVSKKIVFPKRCVRVLSPLLFIYLLCCRPTPIVGHAGPVLS
jgi:hypothetical protein